MGKRVQCRNCLSFMDWNESRTCSPECSEEIKKRDLATVERLQQEKVEKKEKRVKKLQRIRKRNKRKLRAEKKVETLSSKIRALKQNKPVNGFYETRQWQGLRYQVIRKYGRTCMACGTTTGEMHVDHIKPRSLYPNLELAFDNLQILCRACNLGKSNKDDTDWR